MHLGRGNVGVAGRERSACAQDAPWQQYNGLSAIEIPFANGPISTGYVPEVWLKLPGSAPRRFGMDTGSTGIVVAAEHYTPGPGDVAGGPGRLVYNSSGRILNGDVLHDRCRHPARRQRARRHGARAGAAGHRASPASNMRAIAGPSRTRATWPSWAWASIAIRRKAPRRRAPRNPFTHLVSLASGAPLASVRPGYVVTRTGVYLGMTAELTHDFAFVKLAPSAARGPARPNGAPPPTTVSVDGVAGDGTILMDTGINYMFLSPPAGTRLEPGKRAPAGTKIAIYPARPARSRSPPSTPSASARAATRCSPKGSRSCATAACS